MLDVLSRYARASSGGFRVPDSEQNGGLHGCSLLKGFKISPSRFKPLIVKARNVLSASVSSCLLVCAGGDEGVSACRDSLSSSTPRRAHFFLHPPSYPSSLSSYSFVPSSSVAISTCLVVSVGFPCLSLVNFAYILYPSRGEGASCLSPIRSAHRPVLDAWTIRLLYTTAFDWWLRVRVSILSLQRRLDGVVDGIR